MTNHLNGKHGNDENHSSNAAEEKFGAVHTETSTRKRKLKEQLEIVRRIKKKSETNPHQQRNHSKAKNFFGGNIKGTLGSQWEMAISWQYFVTGTVNKDSAQEQREINQSRDFYQE